MLSFTLILIILAAVFFLFLKGGKTKSRNEAADMARKAVEAKLKPKTPTEKDAD